MYHHHWASQPFFISSFENPLFRFIISFVTGPFVFPDSSHSLDFNPLSDIQLAKIVLTIPG